MAVRVDAGAGQLRAVGLGRGVAAAQQNSREMGEQACGHQLWGLEVPGNIRSAGLPWPGLRGRAEVGPAGGARQP